MNTRDRAMFTRRNFLGKSAAITAAVSAASVCRAAMAALPEPVLQSEPGTMPPLLPTSGRPYNPVVTLNGWTLPWRMNAGVKEFHLVAEPVVREMAPGFKAHQWGYNGQSPWQLHAESQDDARIQLVELEQPHLSGDRFVERTADGQGADPHGQSDDDQSPDASARPRVSGHGYRRWTDAEKRATARSDYRYRGGPDAADRISGRRRGRLGAALSQEPPHDECDGTQRADHDRRRPTRSGAADHTTVARLHGDGRSRHGRHCRDGDAAGRQHGADDDRRRPVRRDRYGRDVQRGQDPPRPGARGLRRARWVQCPGVDGRFYMGRGRG